MMDWSKRPMFRNAANMMGGGYVPLPRMVTGTGPSGVLERGLGAPPIEPLPELFSPAEFMGSPLNEMAQAPGFFPQGNFGGGPSPSENEGILSGFADEEEMVDEVMPFQFPYTQELFDAAKTEALKLFDQGFKELMAIFQAETAAGGVAAEEIEMTLDEELEVIEGQAEAQVKEMMDLPEEVDLIPAEVVENYRQKAQTMLFSPEMGAEPMMEEIPRMMSAGVVQGPTLEEAEQRQKELDIEKAKTDPYAALENKLMGLISRETEQMQDIEIPEPDWSGIKEAIDLQIQAAVESTRLSPTVANINPWAILHKREQAKDAATAKYTRELEDLKYEWRIANATDNVERQRAVADKAAELKIEVVSEIGLAREEERLEKEKEAKTTLSADYWNTQTLIAELAALAEKEEAGTLSAGEKVKKRALEHKLYGSNNSTTNQTAVRTLKNNANTAKNKVLDNYMNRKYQNVGRGLSTKEALQDPVIREAYKQRIGWTDKYPDEAGFLEDLVTEIHSTSAVAVASQEPTTITEPSSPVPSGFNGTAQQWTAFKAENPDWSDEELVQAWNKENP